MTTNGTRTVTLELVLRSPDSISGRLSDASGRGTDFVGWLGLAGAIEALAAELRPAGRG